MERHLENIRFNNVSSVSRTKTFWNFLAIQINFTRANFTSRRESYCFSIQHYQDWKSSKPRFKKFEAIAFKGVKVIFKNFGKSLLLVAGPKCKVSIEIVGNTSGGNQRKKMSLSTRFVQKSIETVNVLNKEHPHSKISRSVQITFQDGYTYIVLFKFPRYAKFSIHIFKKPRS